MSTFPTISIVIPTFNRPTELIRAIQSVERQTFEDFECIIVDDNSTLERDYSLTNLDSRFRIIRNEVNKGVSSARMVGYQLSRGKYVTQLDDDNVLFPWAFERMIKLLELNPEVSGVSGLYLFSDHLKYTLLASEFVITPKRFENGITIYHDSVAAVRREIISEWLLKSQLYRGLDAHLWITYHMRHSHLIVNEPWGIYLEGAKNRLSLKKKKEVNNDIREFIMDHKLIFENQKCLPMDLQLLNILFSERRTKSKDLKLIRNWLNERGYSNLSIFGIALSRLVNRFLIALRIQEPTPYVLFDLMSSDARKILTRIP